MIYYEIKFSALIPDEKGDPQLTKLVSLVKSDHILIALEVHAKENDLIEYRVTNIGESNISDVIQLENEINKFHKVKIAFSEVTESGKVKKSKTYILIESNTTKQADEIAREYVKTMLVDCEIETVSKSPISEIIDNVNKL